MADFRNLFEQFLSYTDKPYDYNLLLCKLFDELLNAQQGQTIYHDSGMVYVFDPIRQKKLSLARPLIRAGTHGEGVTNRYLRMDDVAAAGFQGFPVTRPATITAVLARSRSTSPWLVEIRRNGVSLTLVSVPVTARVGYDNLVNIDIEPGDWLQIYAAGTSIEHPIAAVEIAWRLPENP